MKITEKNDLENSILRKIVPLNSKGEDISLSYSGEGRNTFCSVGYLDKNGKIIVKHGISTKRKGDKYDRELGQLIALINII